MALIKLFLNAWKVPNKSPKMSNKNLNDISNHEFYVLGHTGLTIFWFAYPAEKSQGDQ